MTILQDQHWICADKFKLFTDASGGVGFGGYTGKGNGSKGDGQKQGTISNTVNRLARIVLNSGSGSSLG